MTQKGREMDNTIYSFGFTAAMVAVVIASVVKPFTAFFSLLIIALTYFGGYYITQKLRDLGDYLKSEAHKKDNKNE